MKYLTHRVSATDENSDSIFVMSSDGKVLGRLYFFHDDNTTGYLDWLSVDVNIRKQGHGTKMQEYRENLLRTMNFKFVALWCKSDSWMVQWYKRRGYCFLKDHAKEVGCIWLKKPL